MKIIQEQQLNCSLAFWPKGGWRLRNVKTHVELHDIYQGLSREIARRGKFFS